MRGSRGDRTSVVVIITLFRIILILVFLFRIFVSNIIGVLLVYMRASVKGETSLRQGFI
jgi:hypothetical protein